MSDKIMVKEYWEKGKESEHWVKLGDFIKLQSQLDDANKKLEIAVERINKIMAMPLSHYESPDDYVEDLRWECGKALSKINNGKEEG